jgi:alkylation response protein AidB-like acyl-CoA dehydrogenase
MDFELEARHENVRRLVRDFAEAEVAPGASQMDQDYLFPYDIVAKMGQLGLMGVPFPRELGGLGADTLAFSLAIEELARIDASVAITCAAHTTLGTMPIWLFGSEEQKEEWMPRLASGTGLAAFGLTEPGAGSDASAVATTADLVDGAWLIDGVKGPITNAGTEISVLTIIAAVTGTRADGSKELSSIMVPAGVAGFTVSEPLRKIGWHGSDTRRIFFEGVSVPAGNLLGERGRGLAMLLQMLDTGRVGVAAMGLGLAQGVYEQSLEYSRRRVQFGQKIGRFQAIAFKLAEMVTRIEAARLLLYKAAVLKDRGRAFGLEASMAKLTCSELATWAADQAVQIHGGYGFIEEMPVARFFRDAKILTIGEGTSEIQKLVISRAIGAGEPEAQED